VDFVLTRGSNVWAVEVKSSRSGKMPGMAAFRSKYPRAKSLIIGESGVPLEKFFSASAQEWLKD